MIDLFPPFLIFFIGAAFLPLIPKGNLRSAASLVIPIISGLLIWSLPEGLHMQMSFVGLDLTVLRVDKLSTIFGLIFSLAAFLALLYAWHVRDTVQQVASLLYAGSAIGAVFSGDLITLFFFWEGTAIASVFLIWARGTEGAYHTGMRYLIMQIASGVILIAGAALYYRSTGTLEFGKMTDLFMAGDIGTILIFFAFGIKCAFPLLHNWLEDAYPAATVTGTVVLSAFTTKLAVYCLARAFPGTEILIYIGAVMAVFPLFFAVTENDLRRVLAYCLNNQLGFMVVGVGIGTELAINGTAAHAFAHILYKALLFMSVGAVLFRTGTAKGSELGGLYKTMPLTMIFYLVGAASIPFFSGFVSKSLVLSAAGQGEYYIIWGALLFASAGAFYCCGLKVPYAAFFGKDSGLRPKEAPWNMLLAMGLSAFLCVAIGVYPEPLYNLLPDDVGYEPYTVTHVITQFQLVLFSILAFAVLIRWGLYPSEQKTINLDTDWVYRKAGPRVIYWFKWVIGALYSGCTGLMTKTTERTIRKLYRSHGPEGQMARSWPTGAMVLSIAVLLGATLLVNFLS